MCKSIWFTGIGCQMVNYDDDLLINWERVQEEKKDWIQKTSLFASFSSFLSFIRHPQPNSRSGLLAEWDSIKFVRKICKSGDAKLSLQDSILIRAQLALFSLLCPCSVFVHPWRSGTEFLFSGMLLGLLLVVHLIGVLGGVSLKKFKFSRQKDLLQCK